MFLHAGIVLPSRCLAEHWRKKQETRQRRMLPYLLGNAKSVCAPVQRRGAIEGSSAGGHPEFQPGDHGPAELSGPRGDDCRAWRHGFACDDSAMGGSVCSRVERRWNRYARCIGSSWKVDETHNSIRGKWHYLYRAVDKQVGTVDFL